MKYLVLCVISLFLGQAFAQTVIEDSPAEDIQESEFLDKITPSENSVLKERVELENESSKNRFVLHTYRPNYILPYYYTGSPDYAVYAGDIPDDQTLMHSEFKGQLSLRMPIWEDIQIFGTDYELQAAYTQLVYWQLYAESAWFRETNYEPELFLTTRPHENWLINYGLNHQSNGRGGDEERSWNRAYIDIAASENNWIVALRVWTLIFKEQSSDIYNPDIANYLGHEKLLVGYKWNKNVFIISARNLERIDHAAFEATWSHPITDNLSVYVQGFSGYGQSLIEYNHHTNSAGIGLAINDWI
ncbi:MAG: phospholipase A [Legionellales bacterium]|jgi:phospholipase A1